MKIVSWDTETARIAAALKAPPIVCMTFRTGVVDFDSRILMGLDPAGIVHWPDAYPLLRKWLEEPYLHVGQNIAYDMGVILQQWPDLFPLVWKAYEEDRVTDTKIRAQLLDIAAGLYAGWPDKTGKWKKPGYSLQDLCYRFTQRTLQKDGWRMFYSTFRDVPIDGWITVAREFVESQKPRLRILEYKLQNEPKNKELKKEVTDLRALVAMPIERCIEYAVEDAEATLEVYECQLAHEAYLGNQYETCRNAFRQHLTSAWGIRTSAEGVAKFEAETRKAHAEVQSRLVTAGIVREDGTRNLKAAAAAMIQACYDNEVPLRKTEKGNVCLDADACEATDDPVMKDYALLTSYGNILSKDIPMLLAGVRTPVHTRYDLAATGRETSSGPNMQNLRAMIIETEEGFELDVRSNFVARNGWVFLQADFPALELHTLAQSCIDLFGFSKFAEMINGGIDPHLYFAAQLLGMSYEDAKAGHAKGNEIDKKRKIAKVWNFGKPGGMGDKKFVTYLKANKVTLDLETVVEYTKIWKQTFPEVVELFGMAAKECGPMGDSTVRLPRSKRERGGCTYTSWCNTWFQGPGSDVTKRAMWKVAKACYVDRNSPLFQSRIVNVIHDEGIAETFYDDNAHFAALEMGRLMAEGANEFVPDCPFAPIETVMMRKWYKAAEPVFDERGRLVPWEPKKKVA